MNNILEIIEVYKNKVKLKLTSKEYARGYLYGIMDSIIKDNEKYDEISKMIDDIFQ